MTHTYEMYFKITKEFMNVKHSNMQSIPSENFRCRHFASRHEVITLQHIEPLTTAHHSVHKLLNIQFLSFSAKCLCTEELNSS